MEGLPPPLGIVGAGGAMGRSFVFLARAARVPARADRLAAALGTGAGRIVFASSALLGLPALWAQATWLSGALKPLGGALLLDRAWRPWRGAGRPD
jgi:threonine/homoserine/homoserine lactone efflux protein